MMPRGPLMSKVLFSSHVYLSDSVDACLSTMNVCLWSMRIARALARCEKRERGGGCENECMDVRKVPGDDAPVSE